MSILAYAYIIGQIYVLEVDPMRRVVPVLDRLHPEYRFKLLLKHPDEVDRSVRTMASPAIRGLIYCMLVV